MRVFIVLASLLAAGMGVGIGIDIVRHQSQTQCLQRPWLDMRDGC